MVEQRSHVRRVGGPAGRRRLAAGCSGLWCVGWTVLALLYLGTVIVLERCVAEDMVAAYVLRYAPQPLLAMPLGLPLFFAIIFWRPRLVWLNAAMCVLAVVVLMPPSLRAPRRSAAAGDSVRLVTWNVHEEFRQTPAIGETLLAQRPQIVCLQEARRDTFGVLLPGAESAHTHEVTTLTTGHIEHQRAVRLGPYPNYRWGLETRLRLPQGTVTVLNVHFLTAFSGRSVHRNRYDLGEYLRRMDLARHIEADAVVEWLHETAGPRIVAGDFNSPPGSDVYGQVAAAATDAFAACGSGWGYTYRRGHPMIRIDHVFCSPEIKPLRLHTLSGPVSDHRLVVSDFALPQ